MQIRDWMNENQPIVAGVVILVLILAFAKITCTLTDSGSSRGPRITELYYYDMNEGKLFITSSDQTPPIHAPSDDKNNPRALNGVQAFVFSCTDCSDPDTFKIGYLQRYTPRAKELQDKLRSGEAPPEAMMMAPEMEFEIKRVDDKRWVPGMSPEAEQIMDEVYRENCPDGKRPKPCYPKDR